METNHRINSIDIARLFAAILVIAIHTQAIMWLSDRANGSIQILTRVAVPFFFCTSGYFLQKGYVRKDCSAISGTLLKLITDKSICFCIAGLFCLYIYTKPYTVA